MTHFVSESCGGEKCICGKPATHKLGEEIMHDDPSNHPDPITNAAELAAIAMSGFPWRHNLTAYVCCFHFTFMLGPATGCPLTDIEKHALDVYKHATVDDGNIFSPPVEVLCMACNGKLVFEGENKLKTRVFLRCTNCGIAYEAAMKGKGDAQAEKEKT